MQIEKHFNMMAHLTTVTLLYHLDMAEAIVRTLSHGSQDRMTKLDDRNFLEISFPVLLPDTIYHVWFDSRLWPTVTLSSWAEHFLTNDELTIFVPIGEREVHSCLNIMNQHRVICSVAAPIHLT